MKWVVKIIESVTEGKIPLSIDSPNPDTITAGFEAMKNKKGAFINSISLSIHRDTIKNYIELARRHGFDPYKDSKDMITDEAYPKHQILRQHL